MAIESFQCNALKRHYKLISSTHRGFLDLFKATCDAYASSGIVVDLNTMIEGYTVLTFQTTTPSHHILLLTPMLLMRPLMLFSTTGA